MFAQLFEARMRRDTPLDQATRAVDPELVAKYLLRTLNLLDPNEVTPEQIRTASQSTLAMLVNFRAGMCAPFMADCTVQRRTGDGPDDWETVGPGGSPWHRLLKRPNPFVSPYIYWLFKFLAWDYSGKVDSVVEDRETLGRKVPIALHPVYPEFGNVEPILGPQGQTESWVYERSDGHREYLAARDIVRIQEVDATAPWLTPGLSERLRFEIDTQAAENKYSRDMARDQGRPQVSLEFDNDRGWNQELLEELAEDFYDKFTMGNVKGVPVAAGFKIKELGLWPIRQQYIQGRKFTREQIFLGAMTPETLFTGTNSRAQTEAQMYLFSTLVIKPRIESMTQQLTSEFEKIFQTPPDVLRIQPPANVVPEDQKLQAEIDEIHLRSGRRLIDEIRQRDGEDELADGLGKHPLVSSTLTSLRNTVDVILEATGAKETKKAVTVPDMAATYKTSGDGAATAEPTPANPNLLTADEQEELRHLLAAMDGI